jgi:hypothetical protein
MLMNIFRRATYTLQKKAESSLAIQLRTGINGLDAFLFQAKVPSVSAAAAKDDKQQNTSSSSTPRTLVHDMS